MSLGRETRRRAYVVGVGILGLHYGGASDETNVCIIITNRLYQEKHFTQLRYLSM
jgi:hypothetical protein